MVVDGWLELELREPEEALRVLSTALKLRAEWERLLQVQLGQSSSGGEAVQGVSRKDVGKLSDSLVRFLLYTEVPMQPSVPGTHVTSCARFLFVYLLQRFLHSN